jgi:GDP-mannose pyrophosphatase NudK
MADIQILDKEILSNKKYKLENISFQKPNAEGKLQDTENEVYYRPDAAAVLLADRKHHKVLLTRQFRLPTFLNGNDDGYLVEVCAGLIPETESAEATARREALEETGYEIGELTKIGGVYSSSGGITEYVYLFLADYHSEAGHESRGGLASEGENITLVELSFREARKKLKSGEFRDAKTIILLQHFLMFS